MTQSVDTALQLFPIIEEERCGMAHHVAASAVQPLVALFVPNDKHDNSHELQTLLMPVLFLFRGRHDITLVQSSSRDSANPRLVVFKNGKKAVAVTTDTELKDRVSTLVDEIGWSPDCPDETQLPNYLQPIDADELLADVKAFTIAAGQRDYVANAANVASIIWHAFMAAGRPMNWSGFYFVRPLANPNESDHDHMLVLGPFMGKPACSRIRFHSGACGAAWRTKAVQRIADVHEFRGHIACDSASNSELVVPVVDKDDNVLAVIDLDSPVQNGFSMADERTFGQVARVMADACDWSSLRLPFTQP
ncbi:unnamed protein product [Hyaloperonospora brassicae]|uniref:GAF domain-containing protein n=1 Tax=Hyaloperonospora brassicae TaxID=162125 RepID=A0AAV0UX93_HYABA|nr:unnamed protein product [Hyaloperonospora brassicae]